MLEKVIEGNREKDGGQEREREGEIESHLGITPTHHKAHEDLSKTKYNTQHTEI